MPPCLGNAGSRRLDRFAAEKRKTPGQGEKTSDVVRKSAIMGRLATHRRLVGVREALGQKRCASGCEYGQIKKRRFHRVSPNQWPVFCIAFGFF